MILKRIKLENTRKMGAGSESKTFNRKKKKILSFGRGGTRRFVEMAIFRPRAGLLKARLSLPRISENFNLILGL